MVYSKIKYGLPVYGMTSQENILRIQVIQSKLLKVLTNKRIRHSTNKLHNELSILKVEDIIKQEILIFVHNYRNNKLPLYSKIISYLEKICKPYKQET